MSNRWGCTQMKINVYRPHSKAEGCLDIRYVQSVFEQIIVEVLHLITEPVYLLFHLSMWIYFVLFNSRSVSYVSFPFIGNEVVCNGQFFSPMGPYSLVREYQIIVLL